MAFRRRFRRFRRSFRRGPRARTTWMQGWQFFNNLNGHTPAQFMSVIPATNDPRSYVTPFGGAGQVSAVLQSDPLNATSPFYVPLVSGTDLSDFEGNLTVVRVMGHLRIHAAGYIHDPGTPADGVDQLEIRALLYKATEQESQGITTLLNPFNTPDLDARILWSASWVAKRSEFATRNAADESTDDFKLSREFTAWPDSSARSERVRQVSTRQPIRMRGQDRLIMSFAMAPLLGTSTEEYYMRISGYGRVLIRH